MSTEKEKSKYITFTLDLSKIPQEKITTVDKNGEPFKNGNQYVDCIAFISEEPDQFGNIVNVAIKGKAGDKTIYIGNQKKRKEE